MWCCNVENNFICYGKKLNFLVLSFYNLCFYQRKSFTICMIWKKLIYFRLGKLKHFNHRHILALAGCYIKQHWDNEYNFYYLENSLIIDFFYVLEYKIIQNISNFAPLIRFTLTLINIDLWFFRIFFWKFRCVNTRYWSSSLLCKTILSLNIFFLWTRLHLKSYVNKNICIQLY